MPVLRCTGGRRELSASPTRRASDVAVLVVAAAGLSNLAHASIFWGYVIAALVLGTALLVRRDVD